MTTVTSALAEGARGDERGGDERGDDERGDDERGGDERGGERARRDGPAPGPHVTDAR